MRFARPAKSLFSAVSLCLLIFGITGCSSPGASSSTTASTPPSSPEASSIYAINTTNNLVAVYSTQNASGGSIGGIQPPSGFVISTLATDTSGQLYVGGYTTQYDEILVYAANAFGVTTPSTTPVRTIQISGITPIGSTTAPTQLAVDHSGSVYASIEGSASIYGFSSTANALTVPRIITPNGVATISGIAADTIGNLYVLSLSGSVSTVGVLPSTSTGSIAFTRSFTVSGSSASGIAVDGSENVYLSANSSGNSQIEKFASGASGAATPTTSITLPVPSGVSIQSTSSIRIDGGGNLFVLTATASSFGNASYVYGYAPTGTAPFLDFILTSSNSGVFGIY